MSLHKSCWNCVTAYIFIPWFFFLSTPALNFTGDWAEASVKANATYKSFSNAVVSAEVGLHVGLYGINITLKGKKNMSRQYLWSTFQEDYDSNSGFMGSFDTRSKQANQYHR